MLHCPACQKQHVHGEIICPHCGADIDSIVQKDVMLNQEPSITLHVVELNRTKYPEGTCQVPILISRLERPLRIGRSDLSMNPPIRPEIDLGKLLEDICPGMGVMISRLHAALQLDEGGHPAIKHLVEYSYSTWVRHSGSPRLEAIPVHVPHRLYHKDVIVLGDPRSPIGWTMKLRVIFSHP